MPPFKYDPEGRKQLIKVACGEDKADLAIINASLLNVYTGELLESQAVAVRGEYIAYVGKDAGHTIGPQTHVLDINTKTLIPGLIDGHTHLAWLVHVPHFVSHAMTAGTTTIVTETMEPYPIMGYRGVMEFLDTLKDQPIKIFATAPAMVSISTQLKGIDPGDLNLLLDREDVLGLGETYWHALLQEPDRYLPSLSNTIKSGRTLEGHSAGASERKLCAYVSCGVSSCHEPIDATEVLDRLRLGLHVMIREGSIRRDLAKIAEIKRLGIDTRRLILVTDGIEPKDLLEKGYMDHVVQKAIDCGFHPIAAIQMATLNVAEHFGLDNLLGGIAPGRFADMVVIPELSSIKVEQVVSKGRLVAKEGKALVSARKHTYSQACLSTISLPRNLQASDFTIKTKPGLTQARVKVIHQVTDLVTQEIDMTVPVTQGEIRHMLDRDIIKVAAIDRVHQPGMSFVGLIHGLGLNGGALACSAAWDTTDIIVAGADDNDMAFAVNRIYDLQGGMIVCRDGHILAELALPVFGIISDLPMQPLARKLDKLRSAAVSLGFAYKNPLLTLVTLTGAAIPFLRICEQGLVNLKDGKDRPLIS